MGYLEGVFELLYSPAHFHEFMCLRAGFIGRRMALLLTRRQRSYVGPRVRHRDVLVLITLPTYRLDIFPGIPFARMLHKGSKKNDASGKR